MKKFIVLVAFILFCAVSTVSRPTFLANNGFLKEFITHEILALLAVILTITLASVANIHLALNRIARAAFRRDLARGDQATGPVRKEINSNAWLLFWSFIVCVGALLVKGEFADNVCMLSAMNGVALSVLLINVLVLYDIYKTIFALVSANLPESDRGKPSDEAEDYTAEGPEIGKDR